MTAAPTLYPWTWAEQLFHRRVLLAAVIAYERDHQPAENSEDTP